MKVMNKNEEKIRPLHYGGKDNPYEAIKVIDAWDLDFNLGNVVKYIYSYPTPAQHQIECIT